MIELFGVDAVHLVFYLSFATGNFTGSMYAPLVGLLVWLALVAGVCPSLVHPTLVLVVVPLSAFVGGFLGAVVAFALSLPSYLSLISMPWTRVPLSTRDGRATLVWDAQAPFYVLGLLIFARGCVGLAVGCSAHYIASSIAALLVGVLLTALVLILLIGTLDGAYLICYTLVCAPVLVYFLVQSSSTGAALLLLALLVVAVCLCVCIEAAAARRHPDDVRLDGQQTTRDAARRWGLGLLAPLAFAWLLGWLAARLTDGSHAVYRGSLVLAVLGGVSIALIGLYIALFYREPVVVEAPRQPLEVAAAPTQGSYKF
jgi:hypothetical protein